MPNTPATNQGSSKGSDSSDPNSQTAPGSTDSQKKSKVEQEKKRSLQEACLCMDNLRKTRGTRIATTCPELWRALRDDAAPTLRETLPGLEEALKETGPGTTYGLMEGEAAAVLLYTAGTEVGRKVYELVNNALRKGDGQTHSVFVATLVSALRKLRKHSPPVACACHWTDYPPLDKEQFFITRGFLSTTRCLGERPGTLDGKNSVYVIPHKRQVAVLPRCLSFNPDEEEAIFEPGTAFRRVAKEVFEELPPADVVPTITPFLLHNASGGMLVPAQQTQLLFPVGTHFIPCERPTGDPPAAGAAADATQT